MSCTFFPLFITVKGFVTISQRKAEFHAETTYWFFSTMFRVQSQNSSESWYRTSSGLDRILVIVTKLSCWDRPETNSFAPNLLEQWNISWRLERCSNIIYPTKYVQYFSFIYRSISILPVLRMVMEKVINRSIVEYVKNKLFNRKQYGFRKKRSLIVLQFWTFQDALQNEHSA